jgi:hypothetical protein
MIKRPWALLGMGKYALVEQLLWSPECRSYPPDTRSAEDRRAGDVENQSVLKKQSVVFLWHS